MDNFALTSFLHLALRVVLIGALAGFVIALGERALGLDIRKAVDNWEKSTAQFVQSKGKFGDWRPLLIFILGVLIVAGYVLG